jgi:hypothetical protein
MSEWKRFKLNEKLRFKYLVPQTSYLGNEFQCETIITDTKTLNRHRSKAHSLSAVHLPKGKPKLYSFKEEKYRA